MAITAILTEFSLMLIRVTCSAGTESQSGEFLEFFSIPGRYFMTGDTGNILVFSNQFKGSTVMVKVGGRFKCICIMTAGTIGR
jgi:hypothetical protein